MIIEPWGNTHTAAVPWCTRRKNYCLALGRKLIVYLALIQYHANNYQHIMKNITRLLLSVLLQMRKQY